MLPLFGTLDVDHFFHSSGWENDVPHKILNGQWNNGNVFMIKLQKCIKYDSGTTKCTIIEQKIPNNIISKSVKLFGQCYFYVYIFKHVKCPYCNI